MSGEGRNEGSRTPGQPSALELFKEQYWPRYASALADCERRLGEISGAPGMTLGEACTLTLSAGGKRLRPLLVYLSTARSYAMNGRQRAAAAAVELVHTATLIHDDILDDAHLRRGLPTLIASHGPDVSRSSGDYLFSQAFMELTSTGSERAVSLLAQTGLELSLGELTQMEQAYDLDLSYDAYTERCRLKTAGLFATACKLGALLSDCGEDTVAALGEYGYCLGLSFQISDDILDYAGVAGETGKRTGTDLRDGTVTLPLMIALQEDPSLLELFEDGAVRGGADDDARVEEVIGRVEASGALEAARDKALGYVDEARAILERIGHEIDIAPLDLIAGMTVERRT